MSDFILERVRKILDEYVLEQNLDGNYISGFLDLSKDDAVNKLLDGLRLAGTVNFVQHTKKHCIYKDWHPGKLVETKKQKHLKREPKKKDEKIITIVDSSISETDVVSEISVETNGFDVGTGLSQDNLSDQLHEHEEQNTEKVVPKSKIIKPCFMWSHPIIPLNGTPSLMLSVQSYNCCFGKNYHNPEKVRQKKVEKFGADVLTKKRRNVSTIKYSCPAKLVVREFRSYPEFTRMENISKHNSCALRLKLGEAIEAGMAKCETRTYVTVPLPHAHQNHPSGAESGMKQRLHPELKNRIYECVADGVADMKEIKSDLRHFVTNVLCAEGMRPMLDNRSYYPTDRMINNHRKLALQCSSDQLHMVKLQKKIHIWQKNFPESKIFLCNGNEIHTSVQPDLAQYNSQGFLFIYQDLWQSDLLQQFGAVCYFDAAHRYIDGYDFKLYTLYVKVKEQLYLAAMIVNLEDSSDALIDCIRVLQCWNPLWQPENITTDFNYTLMMSLAIMFPSSEIAVSDVIRNREFDNWCEKSTDSDLRAVFDHLNKMIACKNRIDIELEKFIQDLQASYLWHLSVEFRQWVELDFPHFVNYVVNNRSLVMKEEVHRLLKQKRLRFPDGSNIVLPHANLSLSNVLGYMISEHVQDVRQLLLMKHGDVLHESRYLIDVPDFLESRPKFFIKHCMLQLAAATLFCQDDLVKLSSDVDCDRIYSVTLFPGCSQRVNFSLVKPECECNVWHLTNNPCKHMFSAFFLAGEGWHSFPFDYTSSARISQILIPDEPQQENNDVNKVSYFNQFKHSYAETHDTNHSNEKTTTLAVKDQNEGEDLKKKVKVEPVLGENDLVHRRTSPDDPGVLVPANIALPLASMNKIRRMPTGQSIIWIDSVGMKVPYLVTKQISKIPMVQALGPVPVSDNASPISVLEDSNLVRPRVTRINLKDLMQPPKTACSKMIQGDIVKSTGNETWGSQLNSLPKDELLVKDELREKRQSSRRLAARNDLGFKKTSEISMKSDFVWNSKLLDRLVSEESTVKVDDIVNNKIPGTNPHESVQKNNGTKRKILGECPSNTTEKKAKICYGLSEPNLSNIRIDDLLARYAEEVSLIIPWSDEQLSSSDKNGDAINEAKKLRDSLVACLSVSFKVKNKDILGRAQKLTDSLLELLKD